MKTSINIHDDRNLFRLVRGVLVVLTKLILTKKKHITLNNYETKKQLFKQKAHQAHPGHSIGFN